MILEVYLRVWKIFWCGKSFTVSQFLGVPSFLSWYTVVFQIFTDDIISGLTLQANMYYKMLISWTSQKVKETYSTRNAFDFKNGTYFICY